MNDMTVPDGFSLRPQNLQQALELAKLISDSELAPKDYKGKPGNVLIAVQMGQEIGLTPMAAIQNIAVINGKPGLYGDAGKAVLLARGFVIQEDDIELIKKTGIARCRITRPGHPPCERTFSLENAKTASLLGKAGPWTQYPERQLAWRAFWFAARDIAADVLKGLHGAEEIRDLKEIDVTPLAPHDAKTYAEDKFKANLPTWTNLIKTGKKTAEQIIATISSKGALSDEQKRLINDVKADSTAPVITYAQVADKLNGAKASDELAIAADLIKDVADEGQRKELADLYNKRLEELQS